MFEEFCGFFKVNRVLKNHMPSNNHDPLLEGTHGFCELLGSYAGRSFGKGLYRLHKWEDIDKWNDIVIQAFPDFTDRIACFAFDWLGRQFALDFGRLVNKQPQILMFEPGTGEVLEIPCDFIEFHDIEIPNYHDACLASNFHQTWMTQYPDAFTNEECAGYKVMLFLGGEDTVENLEKSSIEVYWELCSQLLNKVAK